jgi:peptidyl-prolyl cis-trans isomerase SurA
MATLSLNSVNKKILKELSKLEIGQYTNPILIPGGFLILNVKDKKEIEKKIEKNLIYIYTPLFDFVFV